MSAARWIALCTVMLFHQGSGQFLDNDCLALNPKNSSNPWKAEIWKGSKIICTGTLINKHYILTAASCIKNQKDLIVRLGNGHSENRNENFIATMAYFPKTYSEKTKKDNIGLLRLKTEVQYKTHIQPICITKNDEYKTIGETFEIFNKKPKKKSFWNIAKSFFNGSDDDDKEEKFLSSNFIGSETILFGPMNRIIQQGILSYQNRETYADVYTNVFAYIDWIVPNALDVNVVYPAPEWTHTKF
ncbi:phenoloxidase-activating enzyme 1-like [Drosophila eugracilis]|uniref:phenoloxidase-activating enzyme 1-like n=1 Tax=Drosophila eugracilis TaxID=29029 RepID=UPI001BD9A7FD|nr:phenoloxidase-activating enzyme 1-like [Drosophila eugracilis]